MDQRNELYSSMKKRWLGAACLIMIAFTGSWTIQPESPLTYAVYKTKTAVDIDGRIDERQWRKAPWTNNFIDITGDIEKAPRQQTRCKMLWDEEYLYIAAELSETDLWATLQKHDDIIFQDNDFEVFIDPNNDGSQYFEIEINALGTVMDLFMHKTYKKGGPADMQWNTQGLRSAVHLNGTLNDNRDTDNNWTLEMAIPFSALERPGRISKPEAGMAWRINFSRVQWQLDKSGNGYIKKKLPDGSRIPEDNWVWSPQGVIDMHKPENWGFLQFRD